MNIVISGWYGHGNVGDEAILQAVMDLYRQKYPESVFTVLSFDPAYTERVHGISAVRQLPMGWKGWLKHLASPELFRTLRAISQCDIFCLGGGGFLSDWQHEAPRYWLGQLRVAKFFGKKTILFRIGAGPFLTPQGKEITRDYIARFADRVVVRDRPSQEALIKDVGLDERKISLAIDPVAELDTSPYSIGDDGVISLVYTTHFDLDLWQESTRKWTELKECYKAQISTLLDEGARVRLVFFQPAIEQELGEELNRHFDNLLEIHYPRHFREAIGILAMSRAVISFRLHGNILAYALRKPFQPIIYHHKGRGFLDMIRYRRDDIVIEVGEGVNWRDLPLDPDEWREKTRSFLNCLNAREVIYEGNPERTPDAEDL